VGVQDILLCLSHCFCQRTTMFDIRVCSWFPIHWADKLQTLPLSWYVASAQRTSKYVWHKSLQLFSHPCNWSASNPYLGVDHVVSAVWDHESGRAGVGGWWAAVAGWWLSTEALAHHHAGRGAGRASVVAVGGGRVAHLNHVTWQHMACVLNICCKTRGQNMILIYIVIWR